MIFTGGKFSYLINPFDTQAGKEITGSGMVRSSPWPLILQFNIKWGGCQGRTFYTYCFPAKLN